MGTVNENEVWKPVVGYEGLYEVSNLGRVRSLDRLVPGKFKGNYSKVKGKVLQPILDKRGYLRINLCNEKGHKYTPIHRVVAISFIENPDNLSMVNHKDENPKNNRVDNLEWCNAKYNSNYGTSKERLSKALKGKKKEYKNGIRRRKPGNGHPIIGISKITGQIIFLNSIKEVKNYEFSQSGIYNCINGTRKTHYGFEWRYLEDGNSK